MIAGLATTLPGALSAGLRANGVNAATAGAAAHLPPIAVLFAAFLGYNPIAHLLGAHALAGLSSHSRTLLTGRAFFPTLISAPFRAGLDKSLTFGVIACLIAAGASLMRGGRYHHLEDGLERRPDTDVSPPEHARPRIQVERERVTG
jgi:hypothetical protein